MSTVLKHWRVPYYLAWLVPVLVASFANYTVSAETNPDALWMRYFQIHFFYWMGWGVIGELAYKLTPPRLQLEGPGLRRFVGTQALMIAGVVCCYSIYYWVINPSLF
ncbi:MAG TPA: hypothetical protein VLB07_03495, partial [Woeseiaceae bacterium]|nr:hypothetical protein [Woeseiaceae bacterium]